MKRLISLISALLILSFCLGVTGTAQDNSVTMSEDLQFIYMNADTYTRFNSTMLQIDYYIPIDKTVVLSETQQSTFVNVSLQATEDDAILQAVMYYNDGASLTATYIRNDLLPVYEDITNNRVDEYTVDFVWPDDNTVTAKVDALYGDTVTLNSREIFNSDCYNVYAESEDGSIRAIKGSLLVSDDNYYFVDFDEAGIPAHDQQSFSPYSYSELTVRRITDTDLVNSLSTAEEEYYEDDFGFIFDDDFTETFSAIFLICLFAVIPFIIFIITLILAIRAKAVYRKLYALVCALSVAELAVFTAITAIIVTFM